MCPSLPVLLAAVLVPLVFSPAAAAPRKLDRKAIEAFAERWFEARPKTRFEDWDEGRRLALLKEAAQIELPEGALDAAVELLWKEARRSGPRAKKDRLDTPFGEATWLSSGTGRGKGLVLGLHGGGEGAGSASEATRWTAKGCLGLYPQGIELVHDTWNTVHGERFLLTLVEIAKVQHEIDPDRVYSMGFSMGGTGSWFLAGRHPDLLAGSAPCAGVLMAQPKSQLATKEEVEALQHGFLPNVRNLAMDYYIGLADRNCMPGTYLYAWDRLLELRAADPEGYRDLRFETFPGLAHAFPPGEPTAGIERLTKHVRDAFPTRVVWEYVSEPYPLGRPTDPVERFQKHHFYWLHCRRPVDRMVVRADRKGNTIDVTVERVDPAELSVLLRPEMFDPSQDLVVRVQGEEVWRGRPAPSFATVVDTLDAKLDRTLVFDRRVPLGRE